MATYTPGKMIECTIQSVPLAKGPKDTIARLMRRDPATAKALRAGQRIRRQTTPTTGRGGRVWYIRPRCGKVVKVAKGQSWQMPYTPDIARDLESVASYLSVK
ncbi:MAG: hypothetical protein KF866_10635 [Phycisphaeraceae bacterium]|nr:hypothetical protein [Phycisphaeraceae bacterium]MCW5754362.1 hypothetical protein [Phycisphaeraceae bacterium]